MKVDGITLLQMIKDGKITDKTKILFEEWHVILKYKEPNLIIANTTDGNNQFQGLGECALSWWNIESFLKFEFEIIEEEKKPEKTEFYFQLDNPNPNEKILGEQILKNRQMIHDIIDKLNNLIKE